jgi:hypothetical protein
MPACKVPNTGADLFLRVHVDPRVRNSYTFQVIGVAFISMGVLTVSILCEYAGASHKVFRRENLDWAEIEKLLRDK